MQWERRKEEVKQTITSNLISPRHSVRNLESYDWDDCVDGFCICNMDVLPLFSVHQRKGQEGNSQVWSTCDTEGAL